LTSDEIAYLADEAVLHINTGDRIELEPPSSKNWPTLSSMKSGPGSSN